MPDIVFHFHRNSISDLPDKLDACAARQSSPQLRSKLQACAKVFRGWLKSKELMIRCERSEESWRWLAGEEKKPGAADHAGAYTFGQLLRLRLYQWGVEQEAEAERHEDAKRLQAAMAEFREGQGE